MSLWSNAFACVANVRRSVYSRRNGSVVRVRGPHTLINCARMCVTAAPRYVNVMPRSMRCVVHVPRNAADAHASVELWQNPQWSPNGADRLPSLHSEDPHEDSS